MKTWPWLVVIAVFFAIGIVLMAAYPTRHVDPNRPDSFGADLAFIFDCKDKADPPSEQAIEQFLEGNGFRVLNKVRLAKEQHVDYSWKTMDIVGLDSARREITFDAGPGDPNAYFVGLYSEPPTRHSTDLENALLELTEKTLGCQNRQVERFENPATARSLYDRSFSQAEGWFQQAAGVPAASTK